MAQLVDVLAMLVRKNFGSVEVTHLGQPVTIETLFETEMNTPEDARTKGDFGCEGDSGKIVIFRAREDGNKPERIFVER